MTTTPLRRAAFALPLLALLPACTVGPNYTPPETPKPAAAWVEEPAGGADATLSPVANWWTTLNDPILDSLIDRAIVSNLDLRIAQARIREARAQRGVVAADLGPQIDATAAYSRSRSSENAFQRISGTGGGGTTSAGSGVGQVQPAEGIDLYQAGFDATWELDVFGRIRRSVEAADYNIESAIENRRDTLVTLLSEVARNYVEARGFQARLAIARANIRSQGEALDLTRARFEAGLGTDLDVARAQAQLSTTESQLPTFDTGLKQSINRLGVLLGQYPGKLRAELEQAAVIPPVPSDVPIGLPSELLRRRPDIRRAERDLAAATANIGIATADLFPRFSLTGSFGFASSQFGDLADMDSRFWSIGPAMRWPILDWGRIRSNIQVQEFRQEQSLATYELTVLGAFEETENALIAYSREQVRRQSLATAVDANQRAVNLATELYTRGLTDFLSVIDAQRSLYLSQDQLVQSDQIVTTNLIALYKALGGGWEEFESPTGELQGPPSPEPEPTISEPAPDPNAQASAIR